MAEFSKDPFNNVIQEGIKGDIDCCFEQGRLRAATILIYSAIDSMATLRMPEDQDEVTRGDFIGWAERYLDLPWPNSPEPLELYAARCAWLHNYGVESRLSRRDEARIIFHCDHCVPEVIYNPSSEPKYVGLSLRALKDALLAGIDRCMVVLHANPDLYPRTEERLRKMNAMIRVPPPESPQASPGKQ